MIKRKLFSSLGRRRKPIRTALAVTTAAIVLLPSVEAQALYLGGDMVQQLTNNGQTAYINNTLKQGFEKTSINPIGENVGNSVDFSITVPTWTMISGNGNDWIARIAGNNNMGVPFYKQMYYGDHSKHTSIYSPTSNNVQLVGDAANDLEITNWNSRVDSSSKQFIVKGTITRKKRNTTPNDYQIKFSMGNLKIGSTVVATEYEDVSPPQRVKDLSYNIGELSVISFKNTKPSIGAPVTARYVNEQDQPLVPNKEYTGYIGDFYKTEPATINNYQVKSITGSETGTYSATPQTVTYVYEKKDGLPVTAKYVDTNNKQLKNSDVLNGKAGDPYQTQAATIPNYDLKKVDGAESGVFGMAPITVTYIYEKKIGAPVTAKYVDEQNQPLLPEKEYKGGIGDPYQTTAEAIKNYRVKSINGSETGVFTTTPQTVTYIYEKISGAPVTAKFVDSENKELAQPKMYTGNIGDSYQTEAAVLNDYQVIKVDGPETGTFGTAPITVTYTYEKKAGAPVTAKYVDEANKEMAPPKVYNGKIGEAYKTDPATVTDHKVKRIEGSENGTFTSSPQTVTYIYEKADGAPVTAEFLDEKKQEISPEKVYYGQLDAPYKTEAVKISGYTVKQVIGSESGIFSHTPVRVSYIYEKAAAEPVTAKYLDEQSKEIASSKVYTGKVGETYQTEPAKVEDYEVKDINGATNGLFSDKPILVTYVYQKVAGADVTAAYVDERNVELASPTVLKGRLDDPYRTKAAAVPNYELKSIKGQESGTFSKKPTTVTYTYEKKEGAAITAKYVDEKGVELTNAKVYKGKLGERYKTEPATIKNFKVKKISGPETGVFGTVAATVTYTYESTTGSNESKDGKGMVTVSYVDSEKNAVSEKKVLTGKIGEKYETTAKKIPGWRVTNIQGSEQGIYQETSQEVIYTYTKESDAAQDSGKTGTNGSESSSTIKQTATSAMPATSQAKAGVLPKLGGKNTPYTIIGAVILCSTAIAALYWFGKKKNV